MRSPLPIIIACCAIALPVAAEDPLWEWVTPWPQGHDLHAAASGNGVTVAVGDNGTVIASTDGTEWRTTHTGMDYRLSDVVWGNGLFVAVGGDIGEELSPGLGVILTSDDGVVWIEGHREDYLTLEAVVWIGTRFVAVGVGDRALLSSDGLSWSESQLGSSEFLSDLAWNGSRLVAIGKGAYPRGTPGYLTSEDGEEWQRFSFDRVEGPSSIAASGGRFVAVGFFPDALVSDDGLNWTVVPYDSPREFEEIVAGGGAFLATGSEVVGTSLDGYVWSIEERSRNGVDGLAWLGDGYLAVGADGFMMSSPDGSQWTQVSEKDFDIGGSWEINELATNGRTIIGVGEGAIVISGRRGTEWRRQFSPARSELNAVIWAGSAFWAVGRYGVIRSYDGIHWEQMLLDYDLDLFDIVWNGSLFVAVGWNPSPDDGRKLILTSPNGLDWTYQWFDRDDHFFTVGWTGLQFVAAGSGDEYVTIVGGEFWQEHAWADDHELTDMAWNGDRLVAVGGVILSTGDGVNWVESELPEGVRRFDDVTWTGTHFVAVSWSSGDVIFTSTDGVSWSSETTETGVWPVSVVGDEQSLYVTGRGLQIIRRTKQLGYRAPFRRPEQRVEPAQPRERPSRANYR